MVVSVCCRLRRVLGLKCNLGLSMEGLRNTDHISTHQRDGQAPVLSLYCGSSGLLLSFPLPSLTLLCLSPDLYASFWRCRTQAPGHSIRKLCSHGTGPTPDSSLHFVLSQEGTALPWPSLGRGWGWVSGLGRVGSRTQKAQCLSLPPLPGPALLWEPGGCPGTDWAKMAACDIHAHLGASPALDPLPPPHGLTLTGCDQEMKLCPHFGILAPALSWHPPRAEELEPALL